METRVVKTQNLGKGQDLASLFVVTINISLHSFHAPIKPDQ